MVDLDFEEFKSFCKHLTNEELNNLRSALKEYLDHIRTELTINYSTSFDKIDLDMGYWCELTVCRNCSSFSFFFDIEKDQEAPSFAARAILHLNRTVADYEPVNIQEIIDAFKSDIKEKGDTK